MDNKVLKDWDSSSLEGDAKKTYDEDIKLANEQGISNDTYNNYSPLEVIMIDDINKGSIELKDLSQINSLKDSLEQTTNTYQSNTTTFKEMQDALEAKIDAELKKQGYNKEEYSLVWEDTPKGKIKKGDEFTYSLIPQYNWKSKNTFTETFNANVFDDLSSITIDDSKLVDITNGYETTKITFGDIKEELNNEVNRQLIKRNLDTSKLNINWDINDDQIVSLNTKLGYHIKPSDETFVGSIDSIFDSHTYMNLETVVINVDKITDIFKDTENDTKFIDIKGKLNDEIYSQLLTQGFTNKEWVDINWDVFDNETIHPGDNIKFTLKPSKGFKDIVHNTLKDNSFKYGHKIDNSGRLKTLWISLGVITLFIVMVAIGLFAKKKRKNSKSL